MGGYNIRLGASNVFSCGISVNFTLFLLQQLTEKIPTSTVLKLYIPMQITVNLNFYVIK